MEQRTNQQNKAAHLFFTMLASALNDAGLPAQKVLKPTIDIDWSPEMVKTYLWKPIQKALYQKESTTELAKTKEIDKVHEILMRHLGEKFGLEYIPFPVDQAKQEENLSGYKLSATEVKDHLAEYYEKEDVGVKF